jgi:diguanylate cyclase (GGDEF)-like protein
MVVMDAGRTGSETGTRPLGERGADERLDGRQRPPALTRATARALGIVGLLRPLSWLLVGGLVIVAGLLLVMATNERQVARADSERLVANAIAVRGEALAARANEYAAWNDAQLHLVVAVDPDWADMNVGPWLHQFAGVDATLVLDPEGRTVYAAAHGARSDLTPAALRGLDVDALVALARQSEPTHRIWSIVRFEGVPALLSIAMIRPEVLPPGFERATASMLVFVDQLDPARVDEIGQHYLLRDFRLMGPGERTPPVFLRLVTSTGEEVGRLTWTVPDAIARLIDHVGVVLGIACAGLAGLAVIVGRSTRQVIEQLNAGRNQALFDALTGLPNRRFFTEELEAIMKDPSAAPRALLFLDLDGFKAVNDRLGHAAGDKLLRVVARRLSDQARAGDMPARLGGDEFALILGNVEDEQTAVLVARRIAAAVTAPIHLDSCDVQVGVSIGVALSSEQCPTAEALMDLADARMYSQKLAHRAAAPPDGLDLVA